MLTFVNFVLSIEPPVILVSSKVSAPPCPSKKSALLKSAVAIFTISSPAPTFTLSAPLPRFMVSTPVPPVMVSSPEKVVTSFVPSVSVTTFLTPVLPVIVALPLEEFISILEIPVTVFALMSSTSLAIFILTTLETPVPVNVSISSATTLSIEAVRLPSIFNSSMPEILLIELRSELALITIVSVPLAPVSFKVSPFASPLYM